MKQNKTQKTRAVHNLVATIFIPNSNNYKFVNFIDGDFSHLFVLNLQWSQKPNYSPPHSKIKH